MKYQVIFFPDETLEHMKPVRAELSKSYQCFSSTNTDEFNQSYHQAGKFLLLFSDASQALRFMHSVRGEKDMDGLEYKVWAYLHTDARLKPESQKKVDEGKVKIYRLSEAAKLKEDINRYFSSGQETASENIEFLLPSDNPGE